MRRLYKLRGRRLPQPIFNKLHDESERLRYAKELGQFELVDMLCQQFQEGPYEVKESDDGVR